MIDDFILQVITTLGFPVCIVIYLLYERRTVTRELSDAINNHMIGAINDLKVEISKLCIEMSTLRSVILKNGGR